jgi:chromodomain-helicase-DNA-binding protein 4
VFDVEEAPPPPEEDEVEEVVAHKAKSKKAKKEPPAPPPPAAARNDDTPSVGDVCDNFGLNDVELEYTEADYQNLTTYKLFQQTYQSRIQGANPKSPKPKLMMLLAAKWREFQASAAEAEAEPEEEAPEEEEEDEEEEVVEEEVEEEEKPRGRGQRRGARTKKAKQVEEVFDFSDDRRGR